jgi:hypothetical protein
MCLQGLADRDRISPEIHLYPLVTILEAFNTFVNQNTGALVLIVAFVALAAFVLAVFAFFKLQPLSRPFAWLSSQWDGEIDSLPALLQTVEKNALDLARVRNSIDQVVAESRTHYKRTGLVRYDAFDGIAGQQSYSLCLLDEDCNGFVLTTLVGANFSRGYVAEISGGDASRKLGEEEARALQMAVNQKTVS